MNVELRRFVPETATKAEFMQRLEFVNSFKKEERPERPPLSLESLIKDAKSWPVNKSRILELWTLKADKKNIGEIVLTIGMTNENRHLIEGEIRVLKEFRRRGFAKLLLTKGIEIAKEHKRSLWISWTSSRIEAGAKFARKFGAKMALEENVNRLELAILDRKLMKAWIENAKANAAEYEIGFWRNRVPEEDIEAVAKLMEVMNNAPIGKLQIEDETVSPEQIRQWEKSRSMRGIESWLCYVRHRDTKEFAGFTQVFWTKDSPQTLYQGGTGVLEPHRGHGLGKWLKSAMVERILEDKPELKYIETGNAVSNAPMLAINKAMGFRYYISEQVWQIEVAKLEARLAELSKE